jgi:hypothetical protein
MVQIDIRPFWGLDIYDYRGALHRKILFWLHVPNNVISERVWRVQISFWAIVGSRVLVLTSLTRRTGTHRCANDQRRLIQCLCCRDCCWLWLEIHL